MESRQTISRLPDSRGSRQGSQDQSSPTAWEMILDGAHGCHVPVVLFEGIPEKNAAFLLMVLMGKLSLQYSNINKKLMICVCMHTCV